MSSAATATPPPVQTLLNGISTQAQAGLTSAIKTALNDLTGIGLGLASEEAQDIDNFTDRIVENLEAGKSWSESWDDAWSQIVTQEKTQLMNAALTGLKDIGSILDGFNKTLQAFL